MHSVRYGCIYPDTCDYQRLMRYSWAGPLRGYATQEQTYWFVGYWGMVLRATFADHPHIERIDLHSYRYYFQGVWAERDNDIWIAARDRGFGAAVQPQYGPVYLWDGCRWRQDFTHQQRIADPVNPGVVRSLGRDGAGTMWALVEGAFTPLAQWTQYGWGANRWFIPQDEEIESLWSEPGAGVLLRTRRYRDQVDTFRERFDGDWPAIEMPPFDYVRDAVQLRMGRGWIALLGAPQDDPRPSVWLRRDGVWQRLAVPFREGQTIEALTLLSIADALVVRSPEGYWREGLTGWEHDALADVLVRRGHRSVASATMLLSERPLHELAGVRWYDAGGLVGCRMRGTQVDCIGSIETHFDLTSSP